jgi:hypothetical protein
MSSSKATYTVAFTESGLPSGTSWLVSLSVTAQLWDNQSSPTSTIIYQEANGSYNFSIGAVNGYSISPTSGTVRVNGGPATQTVSFSNISTPKGKTNQTTGFLGLPGDEGYIVVGGIVAVVAIAAAVLLLRGHRKRPELSPSSKEETEIKEAEKSEAAEKPSSERT